VAEPDLLLVVADVALELVVGTDGADALVAGTAVAVGSGVGLVLGPRRGPQVVGQVVRGVQVLVVDFVARCDGTAVVLVDHSGEGP